MNWLAHLYLSEPDARFRIGSLLPDLASISMLTSLPEPYQRGIRRHRIVDRFTDMNPRVKSCVTRFPAPYRRYAGILTDVYFDYFLARDWTRYSSVPLTNFIGECYRDIETCLPEIPAQAGPPLLRMRDEDWLGSYQHLAGVTEILRRISRRLQRPFDLSASVPVFEQYESAFLEDFQIFFPELVAHAQHEPRARVQC